MNREEAGVMPETKYPMYGDLRMENHSFFLFKNDNEKILNLEYNIKKEKKER